VRTIVGYHIRKSGVRLSHRHYRRVLRHNQLRMLFMERHPQRPTSACLQVQLRRVLGVPRLCPFRIQPTPYLRS